MKTSLFALAFLLLSFSSLESISIDSDVAEGSDVSILLASQDNVLCFLDQTESDSGAALIAANTSMALDDFIDEEENPEIGHIYAPLEEQLSECTWSLVLGGFDVEVEEVGIVGSSVSLVFLDENNTYISSYDLFFENDKYLVETGVEILAEFIELETGISFWY